MKLKIGDYVKLFNNGGIEPICRITKIITSGGEPISYDLQTIDKITYRNVHKKILFPLSPLEIIKVKNAR